MFYSSPNYLLWSIFFFFCLIVFLLENFIHKIRQDHSIFFKIISFSWCFLSLFFIVIFWFFIYINQGLESANSNIILFFTGYLLEISLSIDNVFLWYLIFQNFNIPYIYQKRVLLYGLWGAIILRCFMIFSGKYLFYHWSFLLYLFGIFFLLSGFKIIFFQNKKEIKKEKIKNFWIFSMFRVMKDINSDKFFYILHNKLFVTPLFLSLITIELSDVMFSLDSIPAIFSITDNFFIIFTSNILSVLGLRSIYLSLFNVFQKCSTIKYALAIIFIFIGLKILLEKIFFISSLISFLFIFTVFMTTYIIHVFISMKKHN